MHACCVWLLPPVVARKPLCASCLPHGSREVRASGCSLALCVSVPVVRACVWCLTSASLAHCMFRVRAKFVDAARVGNESTVKTLYSRYSG